MKATVKWSDGASALVTKVESLDSNADGLVDRVMERRKS